MIRLANKRYRKRKGPLYGKKSLQKEIRIPDRDAKAPKVSLRKSEREGPKKMYAV